MSALLLSACHGGANVGQRHHQRHRLAGARIEAKRQIEILRLLRYGVNDNAANPDRIGRMRHAARGIPEQGASDAPPVPIADARPGEPARLRGWGLACSA